MKINRKKNQAGFSLLEMAIILVIISLLAGTVFSLLPIQQDTQSVTNTQNQLIRIQSAIDSYVMQNGMLPCAAPTNTALNNAAFGVATDCSAATATGTTDKVIAGSFSARFGVVPTRTLNLPDNYMFDSWNRRIKYGVVKALATTAAKFTSFPTDFEVLATDTFLINDAAGNRINRANVTGSNNAVAYILVSHGKDGIGATSFDGTTLKSCTAAGTTVDQENCDDDLILVDSFYNEANSAAYYDDIIEWKTYNQQKADAGLSTGTGGSGTATAANLKYGLFTYTSSSNLGAPTAQNTWNTRTFNTTKVNTLTSATLGANTITLGVGKYIIRAIAGSFQMGPTKIRIYNQTTSTSSVGNSFYTTSVVVFPEATMYLEVTSGTNVIRVDQIYPNQNTNDGWGQAYATSVDPTADFLQVHVWQIG